MHCIFPQFFRACIRKAFNGFGFLPPAAIAVHRYSPMKRKIKEPDLSSPKGRKSELGGGGYRVGGLFKNLCATLLLGPPTAGGIGRRRVIFTAGVAGGDEGDSLLQASAACSVKAGGGGRSSLLDGDGAEATG